MNDEATVSSLRWLPPFVAASVAVLGTHLFPAPDSHNLAWEFFYGIGYYVSGFVPHRYALNPSIGYIGFLLWPLLATALVFFLARIALRSSRFWRVVAASIFALSILLWISSERANTIARHCPIFTNYSAANY